MLNNKFIRWSIIFICLVLIGVGAFTAYTMYNHRTEPKYVNKEDNKKDDKDKKTINQNIKAANEETISQTEINEKIAAVKDDSIKSIVRIHEWLNNSVSGNNTPTNITYKSAGKYAKELNQVACDESWNYIKFDLQRAALNLQYANTNNDKQALLIAHRILHDLDVHVFNTNSENAKKEFFGVSQTYRLTHKLPSCIPSEMPPPGA